MTDAQRLRAGVAGIRIVDQTFYRDPPLPEMTKDRTEMVVRTMLVSINLYQDVPR